MSYILDALKKAEHERGSEQSLNLQLAHQTDAVEQSPHSWGLAVIVINLLLIFILLWQQFYPSKTSLINLSPSTQPVTNSAKENSVVMPVSPPAPILAVHTVTPPVITIQLDEVKSADRAVSHKERDDNLVKYKEITVSPSVIHSPEEKKNVLPEKIPFLHELSTKFQQSVLPLAMNAHIYAEQENKRFVLVNGQRYGEGMNIRPGVVLQAIRSDDIVILYQKQYFRLSNK